MILFMALFGMLTVQAQTKKDAKIEFKQTTYDYDTILQNSDGKCTFIYKNTGNSPLIVSSVSSSCGCTTPQVSQEPIMPGKTGTVAVKYNTSLLGKFRKTIVVKSNAANKSIAVLTIKGIVVKNKK